jgi:hypothetical protein
MRRNCFVARTVVKVSVIAFPGAAADFAVVYEFVVDRAACVLLQIDVLAWMRRILNNVSLIGGYLISMAGTYMKYAMLPSRVLHPYSAHNRRLPKIDRLYQSKFYLIVSSDGLIPCSDFFFFSSCQNVWPMEQTKRRQMPLLLPQLLYVKTLG